jgi:hypothetical protein
MNDATHLGPERLAQRRSHLMSEIALQTNSNETVRQTRRHRRLGIGISAVAVAGATAAICFAGFVATSPGLGPVAFAVTAGSPGHVNIRVISTAATATQMTQQLQRRGLHVTVTTLPASPQLVGRWLAVGGSSALPQGIEGQVARQALGKVVELSIPRSFPGDMTLTVGRAPGAGEQPQVFGTPNALAPGGKLACKGLRGASPGRASRELSADGYRIRWAAQQGGPRLAAPPPGTAVASAYVNDFKPSNVEQAVTEPHRVTVVVGKPGTPTFRREVSDGFPLDARTPTVCSPS